MKITIRIEVKALCIRSSPKNGDKSEYRYGVNNNHSIIYNDQIISLL